eukprot:gene11768-biopygen16108
MSSSQTRLSWWHLNTKSYIRVDHLRGVGKCDECFQKEQMRDDDHREHPLDNILHAVILSGIYCDKLKLRINTTPTHEHGDNRLRDLVIIKSV